MRTLECELSRIVSLGMRKRSLSLSIFLAAWLPLALLAGCGGEEDTRVWLKGDLHLHSDHSNDALDNPLSALIPLAESFGMDYFVITDHDNHVDGKLTTWDDPHYKSEKMVMLYGVEWTTARGHANFFGAERFDHERLYALRESSGEEVAEEAARQGLHFSINHPIGKDLWEFGFDHPFDSIEAWNALWLVPNKNAEVLRLWDSLINEQGRRIPIRGGSDCHHQEGGEAEIFNLGNPTTWVYARERSGPAILEALDRGNASISYAPSAERLELWADADGDGEYELLMGDTLPTPSGEVLPAGLSFQLRIEGAHPGALYHITVLKNGVAISQDEVRAAREVVSLNFSDSPNERAFYRAELRAEPPLRHLDTTLPEAYGDMIAITNPIYIGFD